MWNKRLMIYYNRSYIEFPLYWGNKGAAEKELKQCRNRKIWFFVPLFMRHSRYLNECHFSKDLLNSIYYNVMFGLNGKSIVRQARHRRDHTKAISKLTYGGSYVIDSDCCWIFIPLTASSLTLTHRLVVYLQTAKWALVSFFPLSHLFPSLHLFPSPLLSPLQGVDMLN